VDGHDQRSGSATGSSHAGSYVARADVEPLVCPSAPDRAVGEGDRRSVVLFAVFLIAAAVLGGLLRLWRLDEQVLMDDEWHSLLAVRDGWWQLVARFGEADRSIPLTLWHKLLAQLAGMDETLARLLPAACGLATVVALPLWLRPHVGNVTAGLLALLLAIAPLPVYFSRFARPYAPALLCAWLALLALHSWCGDRRRRLAATFVACAAMAVWFLPPFAPFLAAAWAMTLGRGTWWLGVAACVAGVLLLLPALVNDPATLLGKSGRDGITVDTLDGTLALFGGVAPHTTSGAVVVAVLVGLVCFCRGWPLLARMAVAGSVVQWVAIAVAGPPVVTAPSVYSRYCLPSLPLFLLGLAAFFGGAAAALRARVRVPLAVTALAAVLVLLLLGPWRAAYWFPNQWTNHPVLQADYGLHREEIERTFFAAGFNGAYALLMSQPPGSITVVETPFPHGFLHNPYPIVQPHHRQRVVGGFGGELGTGELAGWPSGSGSRREPAWTASLLDLDGLRRRGARYVIVHRDLAAEFPRLWPVAADAGPAERFLRERVGAPVLEDRWVAVFSLAR
jgi:hypothetical protein